MSAIDLFERRNDYLLKISATARGGVGVCLLLGVIGLGIGFVTVEPERVWATILLNTFFFFSLALGGIAFSGIQDVIGAVWARPIKRIHESFAAFLPVASAVLIIFLLCISFDLFQAREVYPWMANPAMLDHFPGKNTWLQTQPFVVRNIAALVVITLLGLWQLRTTTKRDKAFMAGDRAEATKLAVEARDKLRHWCAPILLIYALCYSLLGFDMLMSLAPTWFSTLWGGWLFAIMMQTLMATILVFLFALRATPVGEIYQRQQFHDVGKLMHGFTVFFAYLTYAHVLTYWYGNVPEETEYFLERLHGPWLWVVLIAPFLNFVIPLYALIFKAAKWTLAVTIPLCFMILSAQWVVYILIVIPAVDGHAWHAPWLEGAGLLLMLGMFLASWFAFSGRNPLIGVADALLPESLAEQH